MQKIKYTFADGTTNGVEVTDELYALHEQLANEEKRNNKRETRRHTSLYYFTDISAHVYHKYGVGYIDFFIMCLFDIL